MSPSSSGSWASGPGDIIDLDRYMRGNVRPSRALSDDTNERLVVDGGGCKPRSVTSGDSRFKRASLDSGVSDGSYRRRRRTHTKLRRNYQEDANFYPSHDKALTKSVSDRVNSSHSMRAFRTVCEQALLDQQQQIARVAQLCERLTERAERSEAERNMQCVVPERNKQSGLPDRNKQNGCLSPQNERKELPQKTEQKKMRYRKLSVESSEISSSSRSSKDLKRKNEQAKDTYRTQECKTYKIIMTKLDELNRLFATRPPRVPRPSRPPRSASSSSVSVCDKLISTDPQRTYNRVLAPSQRYRNINGPKTSVTSALRSQYNSARTVTQVFAVDIAPRDQEKRTNVLTESIVKCESSGISSRQSVGDPRCGFDLDDPVHLYSQSKRLQSPATRSRRTRSEEPSPVDPWSEQVGEQRRSPSLCAVCRGYWRYLRRCVPVLAKMFDANKC